MAKTAGTTEGAKGFFAEGDGRDYAESLDAAFAAPSPDPKYLALDLFAGCGGLSLGFEAAGFATIGYEADAACVETYRKNLRGECVRAYLTTETEYPRADVVIGGPPCQPFSRRGLGLGPRDARDGFPAFATAIRKVRPKMWAFENVKALASRGDGYFERIADELRSLGYVVDWTVARMSRHGVPQNRERLVVVGHRGEFRFPEEGGRVVTAGEALGALAREAPDDAEFLTPAMDAYVARYEAASKCARPRDLRLDAPARTLTCRNLAGATGDMMRLRLPDGRRRRLTAREAARLQGFPDRFEFVGTKAERFRQIGNAVPPPYALALAKAMAACLATEEAGGVA